MRVLAIAVTSLLLATPAASAAPRGLDLGFLDGALTSPDASTRATLLDEAQSVGAGIVRLELSWNAAAPVRPATANDPNDPAYRWATTDAAVRDASTRGLRVILSINGAPAWAEGAGRPRKAKPGTWKPNAAALGAFAEAAARRYSGITRWQIWNEPNLNDYLNPLWKRRKGGFDAVGPQHYRRMLNAAYAGIKRANRRNIVATAGLAPYGDVPGQSRVRPVTFWREVLRRPTHFDVLAHHPYSVAGPQQHAIDSRDVSVPDLGRLTRVVRRAVRRGTALPRRSKRLWVTEISWDSSPPDPNGVPAARLARWVPEALYTFWKAGADTVLWYQVRDQAPTGGYDITYSRGCFSHSGARKLAAEAFSFPVACERARRARLASGARQRDRPAPISARSRSVDAHLVARARLPHDLAGNAGRPRAAWQSDEPSLPPDAQRVRFLVAAALEGSTRPTPRGRLTKRVVHEAAPS